MRDQPTGNVARPVDGAEEQQSLISGRHGDEEALRATAASVAQPAPARLSLPWGCAFQTVGATLLLAICTSTTLAVQRHRAAAAERSELGLSEFSVEASRDISTPLCHEGGQSYPIKAVLHNNLAGKGPDSGAEGLVYLVSRPALDGHAMPDLKISVHALSPYAPANPEWNGVQGEFGAINLIGGKALRVRIQFSDVADLPLRLDSFTLFLCDLEGNPQSSLREYARAFGPHKAYWSEDTQMGFVTGGGYTEYWQKGMDESSENFGPSATQDLGPENPTYIRELTAAQLRSSVSLEYRQAHDVDLVFGSEAAEDVARFFFFAFVSLDGCNGRLATSRTTTSSATKTSFTRTSHTTSTFSQTSATTTQTSTSATTATTSSTAVSSTSTSMTVTSATLTSTTATAMFGIPLFGDPGKIHWWHWLSSLSRQSRAFLYGGALLALALLLTLYWLISCCCSCPQDVQGLDSRVLLRL